DQQDETDRAQEHQQQGPYVRNEKILKSNQSDPTDASRNMLPICGLELLKEPVGIRLRLSEGRARAKPRHDRVIPTAISRVDAQLKRAPEIHGRLVREA